MTKTADEYADQIFAHGESVVPAGHFVIVIVDDGSSPPGKGRMVLRMNCALNPGITVPAMLRALADGFERSADDVVGST